jgi:hypothetical protein
MSIDINAFKHDDFPAMPDEMFELSNNHQSIFAHQAEKLMSRFSNKRADICLALRTCRLFATRAARPRSLGRPTILDSQLSLD